MAINDKRVHQQVRNFEKILQGYRYDEPFSRYLTRFFKQNKQMGSSDRRMTSRFCYNYFRLGNALPNYSLVDRLVVAEFLCTRDSAVVQVFKPEWVDYIDSTIPFKIKILEKSIDFNIQAIFPCVSKISTAINQFEFLQQQFVQPDLFIRIRQGDERFVLSVLEAEGIYFEQLSGRCLRLTNGTNLQRLVKLDGKYEVQDLSSQQTLDGITIKSGEKWWDTCAASGGKSLLLLDKYPKTDLLVSDVRLSILRNLDERFEKAGVTNKYRKKILDLSKPVDHLMQGEQFDGLLIDAPCSGSGTWGRTPEMMLQFDEQKLAMYADLQKSIVRNALPYLKKGGQLIYITCSVYKDENEEAVQYLLDNFDLELVEARLIEGYVHKADSMFAAHFIKKY